MLPKTSLKTFIYTILPFLLIKSKAVDPAFEFYIRISLMSSKLVIPMEYDYLKLLTVTCVLWKPEVRKPAWELTATQQDVATGQLLQLLMSLPKALKTFLFFKHIYIWLRISGKFNTMTTQPVTLAPSAQVGKAGDNQKFQARLSYIGRPCV